MQSEIIPFYELDLYKLLTTIRNDGLFRDDETRLIMNAVVGKRINWKREHCRDFYEAVIRESIKDINLELILATSGYGEGYDGRFIEDGGTVHKNNASQRRKRYKRLNPGVSEPSSLNVQENRALKKTAEKMLKMYESGELLQLIGLIISAEDLTQLGFFELVSGEEKERIRQDEAKEGETEVPVFTEKDGTSVPFFIRHIQRSEMEGFISREDVILNINNLFSDRTNRKTVILSGMGGVGKTQTALKYIAEYKDEYDVVLWLDATSEETLERDIRFFLSVYDAEYKDETHKPFFTGKDGTGVPFFAILFQRFFSRIADKKILIVYDNADFLNGQNEEEKEKCRYLSYYLPDGNCHFLITTRCSEIFNDGELIQLDVFSPEEAERYLREKTGLKVCEETKELAKRLGYLPLALSYAGAYIKMHLSSYNDYLELWDKYGMTLFDEVGFSEMTVRKALNITLDKLDPERQSAWYTLLGSAASVGGEYFVPEAYLRAKEIKSDEIKDEKTKEYVEMLLNPLVLNRTMHFLVSHSLADWDGKRMYLHPLLQEVISEEYNSEVKPEHRKALLGHDYEGLMRMYRLAGDEKLAEKYGNLYAHSCLETLETLADYCREQAEDHGGSVDYEAVRSSLRFREGHFKRMILEYGTEEDKKRLRNLEKTVKEEEKRRKKK